ncbi:MAG: alpha/beta hydrolase [Alkalinema sp. CAN_BIN05]|nr:alpha/beta hydrolase [Alkalinema sp. CAN_BIN05]
MTQYFFISAMPSSFSQFSLQLFPQIFPQLALTTIAAVTALITTTPAAQAADRIYVTYGLLERSIGFDALENFAKTGEVDDDLFVYTSYVSPAQRQEFRSILQTKADVSPVAISQFLYSPQGELLLKRLGQVIQSEARTDGAVGIRAALILAAADSTEGFSPLSIIRKFPTRGIRVDLQKTLQVVGELERLVSQTQRTVSQIVTLADRTAAASPITRTIDLTNRGRIPTDRFTVSLTDNTRVQMTGNRQPRSFPVDVYLPRISSNTTAIVISHGVGSDRTTFKYLATHLASHGFAVFVPEHPGSNANQIQSLLRGLASEVAEPTEFIDRPLDVKYLLDYFSNLSRTDSRLKSVNFQKVGVLGQSFGAYTALALAGAPLNFQSLNENCTEATLLTTFNVSLSLQCRATQLFNQNYPLADSRIAAVISINPLTSVVFGPASLGKIKIPTMIVSSGSDTVAPSLPEQILPFTQLKMPDRYLVMMPKGSHFSTLEDAASSPGSISVPEGVIGPNPAQARRYMNALSLAFFRTYLTAQGASFRSFLTSSYVKSISDPTQPISLVNDFDPTAPPIPSVSPAPIVSPAPTDDPVTPSK